MCTNRVFGTAKCVLFIEVSSFQGVLIKWFHCTWNLSNPDTLGTEESVLISEVS